MFKEDGTSHFIGSDRCWNDPESGGYLNHCTTFTNGSMFALLGPRTYHTFDLKNGKRVGKNYTGDSHKFYCPTAKSILSVNWNQGSYYTCVMKYRVNGYEPKKIVQK